MLTIAKFHDASKTDNLTSYEFQVCGYVQEKKVGEVQVRLWHEGATFHVRAYDFAEHRRLMWECYPTLGKARKAYLATVRHLTRYPHKLLPPRLVTDVDFMAT